MFPLSAEKLPLLEIADKWSREIVPRASLKELLSLLEAAWWKGEIKGNSALDRLQFLQKMFESRRQPYMQSVVFVSPRNAGQPTEIHLADGGVVVRPEIFVPDKADDWTENSCTGAFEALAGLPSQEYFPLLSYSISFIDLTPEEFFGWAVKRGFDVPKFWKRNAEIGMRDTTWHDGRTSSPRIPAGPKFGGRGTKKRAIQLAFKTRFPNGDIPPGMTSGERNDLIWEDLKMLGLRSLPDKRTIQRALKDPFDN
jgi:hypothetical protein